MKIVLSHCETGKVFEEIDEPTISQIVGMSVASIISLQGKKFLIEDIVYDFDRQLINILLDEYDV